VKVKTFRPALSDRARSGDLILNVRRPQSRRFIRTAYLTKLVNQMQPCASGWATRLRGPPIWDPPFQTTRSCELQAAAN